MIRHPIHLTSNNMDTNVLLLGTMTATRIVVTFSAWRIGNERRDVMFLGVFGGLLAAGTGVVAMF